MNYVMIGIQYLKYSVLPGVSVYIVIVMLLYALKIRRNISWKCVSEIFFCIYSITVLKIVGIFSLDFSWNGLINYNLVPFIGSSITPVLLNFVLFVPYGFLLPFVFKTSKWNWKKIIAICGLTSLLIELLQMFGGRYAEIDDLLINTFGAFSGYLIYTCGRGLKKNYKKTMISLASLCIVLPLIFIGIYLLGNNEKTLPDGLHAAEGSILEVNVYSSGERRNIEIYSDVYNSFSAQISNCGGHLLESRSISESKVMNTKDCFIEIIYVYPQTIVFENAKDFTIQNADRILYNADENVLYWGNSGYQNCLDYTKLNDELQEHEDEILEGYEQLRMQIMKAVKGPV